MLVSKINRIQCIEDSCVEKGPYPLPSRDKRAGSAAAAHSTRLLDHLEHCLENDVKFFYISFFGLVTKAGRQIVVQQISGTRHQLLVLSELVILHLGDFRSVFWFFVVVFS